MKVDKDSPLAALGVIDVLEITETIYTVALGPDNQDSIKHHNVMGNMVYDFRWQGQTYRHWDLESAITKLKELDRANRSDDPKDRMWKLPTY